MHNGSCVPASYAKVTSAGKPPAVQAQLHEIQALERREAAFKKEIDSMCRHGYDLAWYARSGGPCNAPRDILRGREESRRRIEREFPEQVARYMNSTREEGDVIHGENNAADIYERLLNTYFYENCGAWNHD